MVIAEDGSWSRASAWIPPTRDGHGGARRHDPYLRLRAAGIKPLALAALLFAWLIFGGAAINLLVGALLG